MVSCTDSRQDKHVTCSMASLFLFLLLHSLYFAWGFLITRWFTSSLLFIFTLFSSAVLCIFVTGPRTTRQLFSLLQGRRDLKSLSTTDSESLAKGMWNHNWVTTFAFIEKSLPALASVWARTSVDLTTIPQLNPQNFETFSCFFLAID